MVNANLREALQQDHRSKGSLSKHAAKLAREHRVNVMHAHTSAQVALSLASGHRRRLAKGRGAKVPYVRKLFLRADDKTFHDVRREGAPDFSRGVNRARPDTFMFYHCLTLVA
jgi:hypothetical protein